MERLSVSEGEGDSEGDSEGESSSKGLLLFAPSRSAVKICEDRPRSSGPARRNSDRDLVCCVLLPDDLFLSSDSLLVLRGHNEPSHRDGSRGCDSNSVAWLLGSRSEVSRLLGILQCLLASLTFVVQHGVKVAAILCCVDWHLL
jgi:hypothetical protein